MLASSRNNSREKITETLVKVLHVGDFCARKPKLLAQITQLFRSQPAHFVSRGRVHAHVLHIQLMPGSYFVLNDSEVLPVLKTALEDRRSACLTHVEKRASNSIGTS